MYNKDMPDKMSDYTKLIELQKIDLGLEDVSHRRETIPQQIQKEQESIKELNEEMEEMQEKLKQKQVELKIQNSKIDAEREKERDFRAQLLKMKTNAEYQAMQSQIEHQKNLVEELENHALDIMEEIENLKSGIPLRSKEIENSIAEIKRHINELKEEFTGIEHKRDMLNTARAKIKGEIRANYLKKYERLKSKGFLRIIVPVKEITDEKGDKEYVCTGCNSVVPFEAITDLKSGKEFQRCENCGRYLYIEEFDGKEV